MARFTLNGSAVSTPEAWRYGLAEPERHWRPGYSAWALAHSWMAADGFPPEVRSALLPQFPDIVMREGLVEHKVQMPGRGRASQNDLFVIADFAGGHVCIAVEGKVNESFGPLVSEWRNGTPNRESRFAGLLALIGLPYGDHSTLRYQFLHRMASPVAEARMRGVRHAVMLVHSFSADDASFADFRSFAARYAVTEVTKGTLYRLTRVDGIVLYGGWVTGDRNFLSATRGVD